RAHWPEAVRVFAETDDRERFVLSGHEGNQLDYMVRHSDAGHGDDEVWCYSATLGDVAMDRLTQEIRQARDIVETGKERDLGRGLKLAYILLAAAIWLVSLALLVYLAHRISRPIHQLTAGLTELAAGDLNARVKAARDDEMGRAIQAFNHMAEKLQES